MLKRLWFVLWALAVALALPAPTVFAGGGGGCMHEAPAVQAGWVAVLDNCFSPQSVAVGTGEAVSWRFDGQQDHTITFDHGIESGILTGGSTFAMQFNEPDTFYYFCAIHPGMTGSIDVTGRPVPGAEALQIVGAPDATAGQAQAAQVVPVADRPAQILSNTLPLRIELSPLAAVVILLVGLPLSLSAALAASRLRPSGPRVRLRSPLAVERPAARARR